jgi:hypothetical protein
MNENPVKNNVPPDRFKESIDSAVGATRNFLDAQKISRRQFIIGTGAGVVAGKYGEKVLDAAHELFEDTKESSEHFEASVSFYETLYGNTKSDQILFFDDNGGQIGEPVNLEPITLPDGRVLPPELPSDTRIFEINGEWVDAQRVEVAAAANITADVQRDFPGATHTISVIRAAKREDPELQAETLLDIVKHYGAEPVSNHPDKTRLKYVYENFGDILRQRLPGDLKEIADALIPFAIGIPFQETQYRSGLVSRTGARGVFQFQPETWPDFNDNPEEIHLLSAQVEAAQKKLIQILTYYVRKNPGDMALIQREYFDGNRKNFIEQFLVPAIINGYQAGQGTISGVIERFAILYREKNKLEERAGKYDGGAMGYDVYLSMIRLDAARSDNDSVGDDTTKYVLGVYAGANLLKSLGYEAKKAA